MTMWRELRTGIVVLLLMTLLTGLAYPLVVTAVAKTCFPRRSEASLIERNGQVVGSALIGQSFDDPKYFWGRLSATNPPYNAAASGGSNLGPLNPALTEAAKTRAEALRKADPSNTAPIPVDLLTSSGSGLDGDISVAAALYQAPRVARERHLEPTKVAQLVWGHVTDRQFGVLGEKRVNVLKLNLALEGLQ
jgi:potassium-transporting ATPase KdpC subunit